MAGYSSETKSIWVKVLTFDHCQVLYQLDIWRVGRLLALSTGVLNCLGLKAQDQDSKGKTKTKTVKILPRGEAVPQGFPSLPYILAYKLKNFGLILARKVRGSTVTYLQGKLGNKFGAFATARCRRKQLQWVPTALLPMPLLPSNAIKGRGIYYTASIANCSWRRLCLFHSVGLVVLNFRDHYSCTVHSDVNVYALL